MEKENEKVIGTPFTSENSAEMQRKSVEARKHNKAVAEILREELAKKVGDLTKLEWLTQKAINNCKDEMTLKDLKLMQDILGESVTNMNVETNTAMTKDELVATIRKACNDSEDR